MLKWIKASLARFKKRIDAELSEIIFGKPKVNFYASRAWLDLRYRILRKQGRKCAACGSTSGPWHVDHVIPRSKRPDLELKESNLQVLCESCNLGKSNKWADDWRKK